MLIGDFFGLIYPNICYSCGKGLAKGEKHICSFCRYKLPVTNYHLQRDNPVEKMFWGRVELRAAASLYFFRKGNRVQRLIHQLKYKGKKGIGETLGQFMGNTLPSSPEFQCIDTVIPVPLHPAKKLKRGYNQCDPIAEAAADGLNAEVQIQNLFRNIKSKTQTKKSRYKRWQNVEGIFQLRKPELIENKTILLIDDVITTGSTLEACTQALTKIPGTQVCIATVACA